MVSNINSARPKRILRDKELIFHCMAKLSQKGHNYFGGLSLAWTTRSKII